MRELERKIALVTGGARGLGEATCEMLAQCGATVIPVDIRKELLDQVSAKISRSGGKAFPLQLDIGDEEKVEEAMKRIDQEFGRLDILVNNAGVDTTLAIDEMSIAQWDNVIKVNLRGPFLMSRFALGFMKKQSSGNIVNIVSTAAKRAWANAAAYHASKWGFLGFSHALHVEARQFQIKVTALISGGMRTPFLLDRFPDIDISTLQDPRNVAQTIRHILTLPEETVIPEVMVVPMKETSWP